MPTSSRAQRPYCFEAASSVLGVCSDTVPPVPRCHNAKVAPGGPFVDGSLVAEDGWDGVVGGCEWAASSAKSHEEDLER